MEAVKADASKYENNHISKCAKPSSFHFFTPETTVPSIELEIQKYEVLSGQGGDCVAFWKTHEKVSSFHLYLISTF